MRNYFFAWIFSAATFTAQSQSIVYHLNLDNIAHHELGIRITFSGLTTDSLEIRMPSASPGRYALHNFAKNVYEVAAFSETGSTLEIVRPDPYSWKIPVVNGQVLVDYTLYGNHADGTYAGIDSRKLHLNMPATFVYGVGLEDVSITLIIPQTHPDWDVATQLVEKNDTTFTAPNYYYFYDSPTMVTKISWRQWEVNGQTIRIAMMHEGTEAELDAYTEWVKKVVEGHRTIYGELPKFDYGQYTFLAAYNPWVYGDGMEHRNSTICSSSGNLAENANQLIGTISHEFFHCWNIERIRPKSLEPFDFDHANISEALWFGEGFTSYFDALTLTRAGIKSPDQYVNGLIGGLNYVLNSPARAYRGPVQMSQFATFTDAGVANDETNFTNNFVSYYSYGSVIALGLDLTLRSQYNKTLDEFMRLVWQQYGKPEIPYTLSDLEKVLAQLTGDKKFAEEFFQEEIYGTRLPDFDALFAEFGINMSLQNPNSVYFNSPRLDNSGYLQSPSMKGTALYDAGMEKGDRLISINNVPVHTTNELNKLINSLEVGKTYSVTFEQLGVEKTGSFTAVQDPRVTLAYLSADRCTKKALKKRNEWLHLED